MPPETQILTVGNNHRGSGMKDIKCQISGGGLNLEH